MFDRYHLKPGDKVWYEAGFPDIRRGTIKARRELYNDDGSRYVEYQFRFWSSRGSYRSGMWLAARFVVGMQDVVETVREETNAITLPNR